jgi:hypothetical protein
MQGAVRSQRIWTVPFIQPTTGCLGVRSVGFRIGWTRANGTLRRQTMTSAPCSTRARDSETRSLNSAIFTGAVTLSGGTGDDVKHYQEKQVRRAIDQVQQ